MQPQSLTSVMASLGVNVPIYLHQPTERRRQSLGVSLGRHGTLYNSLHFSSTEGHPVMWLST